MTNKWLRGLLTLIALAALTPLPAVKAQQKQLLEYPSVHSPTVGTRGMVVSQNEIASRIGADILRRGGNAVDAAVAIGFALAVTLPRAGNIGGDGFITLYEAKSGKVHVIDFRGVAPRAATLERFVNTKGKELPEASTGYIAPAVPGTVAGLHLAHRKYGRLRWAELLAPAIRLALEGVELTPDEAFVFGWGKDKLAASAAARRTFYKPDGSLYRAGERLRQRELAWTLRRIARGGADAFLQGRSRPSLRRRHGGARRPYHPRRSRRLSSRRARAAGRQLSRPHHLHDPAGQRGRRDASQHAQHP